MKTIAVSIDEPTLQILDTLMVQGDRKRTRSALVRLALQEFAARERLRAVEAHEREILRRNRKQLARQARALVASQARV